MQSKYRGHFGRRRRARAGQSADAPAPPKARKARLSEAVESGVEGLLRFFVRFLSTARQVVLSPRTGILPLLRDRRQERPRFVLPFTFLAICTFLLSLLGQTAGVNIIDWVWFADEIGQKVTESLRKEFSLTSVVVQAIPGMLGVLLLAGLYSWLTRPWVLTSRLATTAFAYALGAQSLCLFLVVFGSIGGTMLLTARLGSGNTPDMLGYLVLTFGAVVLVAALVGPTVFAYRALRLRRPLSGTRKLRAVAANVWLALSLLLGHVVVLYGAMAPADVISVARGDTSPRIGLKQRVEVICVFRSNPPPVPIRSRQPFQFKPASDSDSFPPPLTRSWATTSAELSTAAVGRRLRRTGRPTRWATRGAPRTSCHAAMAKAGRWAKYCSSGVASARLECARLALYQAM